MIYFGSLLGSSVGSSWYKIIKINNDRTTGVFLQMVKNICPSFRYDYLNNDILSLKLYRIASRMDIIKAKDSRNKRHLEVLSSLAHGRLDF